MAALTSSNVRIIRSWTEGQLHGKRRAVRRVEVHGAGLSWGGSSNTMPATAFNLRCIEEVSPVNYGEKGYLAVPSVDGTLMYIMDTAGAGAAAADITVGATPLGMYFTVKGY